MSNDQIGVLRKGKVGNGIQWRDKEAKRRCGIVFEGCVIFFVGRVGLDGSDIMGRVGGRREGRSSLTESRNIAKNDKEDKGGGGRPPKGKVELLAEK